MLSVCYRQLQHLYTSAGRHALSGGPSHLAALLCLAVLAASLAGGLGLDSNGAADTELQQTAYAAHAAALAVPKDGALQAKAGRIAASVDGMKKLNMVTCVILADRRAAHRGTVLFL